MKYIQDIDLTGKRVLIRADLNVPLDESQNITDDNRIKEFLPTLKLVLEKGGRPILMSHLGSPNNRFEAGLSLTPVAKKMSTLLGIEVTMAPDCVGPEVEKLSNELRPGQILLLENLRFHQGEQANDLEFASLLQRLGDVYINDAFATAHRKHASISKVAELFKDKKAAGLLIRKELEFYEKAMVKPKTPLAVVLGGAKVSTKLKLLLKLSEKADKLIIGGAMANTFLAAQGLQVGKSLVERDLIPKVMELMGKLARRDCKLYLPVDLRVGSSLKAKGEARAVTIQEIPADSMALDIGPASSILFKEALESVSTIVWNGPMGAYENEDFATGTTDMVQSIASTTALKIVGGGDTDAAIHQMQLAHKFDFISTGGGAFLALLEGEPLPALQALEK